ncbi:MAG: MopE-related protein [Bacteroidia bacterium]
MKNKNYTNANPAGVLCCEDRSPSVAKSNLRLGITKALLSLVVVFSTLLFFANQAKATTCAGATVLAYQNYTGVSVTCGATNDITSANSTTCGSGSYKGGFEALYKITSIGSGSMVVSYSGQSWTGITVYAGCPTSGGTCLGSVTSSLSSKSLTVTIANGVDYYIMFDTWPTPNSPCPGTFSLTVPAAAVPCTGTPTPGNTTSSVTNACTGTAFTLGLQNSTTGTGVSYQWQSSPDGSSWSNFGTDASTQSLTQTAPTYYQCIVTCSGNSGTSNPVLVGMNTFLSCYCIPTTTNGCTAGDHITNVTFSSTFTPINNTTGTCLTASYSDYTGTVAAAGAYVGDLVSVSVSVNNGGTEYAGFWIDFDHSGSFDAAEFVTLTDADGIAPWIYNGTVTIPVTATTGLTRMRARSSYAAAVTAGSACAVYSYGETEDYLVNLQVQPPCIDPPTAGTTVSSVTQFCNSGTVNLTLSLNGNSTGSGQTYQWQESDDNVTWTNILGATGTTYAYNALAVSKYFQCLVTCGASTVPSTAVFVEAVDPPVAGTISGPASVYANQPAVYSSSGENGSLQWQARLLPSGTFANVSGATNNPQTIYFSAVGSYEIQLVTSLPGCSNAISNVVTTAVSIQNDNVCNAIPVNIGLNGPFTNSGATTEAGEPIPPVTNCNGNGSWCGGQVLSNTVWFTFTVPSGGSGRYAVALPGWDSQVAIYKAASCGDILTGGSNLWAANDDSSGSPYNAYAQIFCLTPGETVYIQVDGYGTGTNSAFALRIDDKGAAADASFSGLPATICENGAAVSLSAVTAGGTFSGSGVSGNSFDPAAAGAGFHTISYHLGGLDTCVYTSQVIEVIAPAYTYYGDADGDGYGDGEASIQSCDAVAPSGYSADGTDCNDADVSINPGATETCNGIDDDCNGIVDNGFDNDGDGYTSCNGDCDDNNASVYPGAAEVCNGVDDDCNLLIDDGLTFITYYADVDGDTYGDAGNTVSTCNGAPAGYVSDNTDCNDNNASANPAGTEVCNSIDDDCDGLIDENLLVAGPISGPAVQCVAVVTGSATYSIASVADASTYTWTVPSGMTILSGQGTNSIFVSWTPIAAHNGIIGNLTVTPSNACGAGTPSSVLIDINYTKPVMPNSISGPVKVCPGDVAVYSTNLIERASYFVWSVPAGMTITSGASTNVITVSVGAGYAGGTVSVSGANGCGIGAARLRAVTVNTPGVSASISGQASGVCGATGVSYSCAAVAGATSYNWTVPAGASIISGQGSSSISVDFTGSYAGGSFSVVASNACGSGAARSLTVSGAPGQPGIISGDQSICPGQSNVPYSVSTVAGASLYTWSVPSIASIASGQGTKDIYVNWGTNPTTGQQVTVYASNGCGNGPVRILNGIAIDLGNCVRIGETGAATGLNIFPNPASEVATIVFNGTEGADFNLNMVDVAGRVVMSERGTAVDGQNQRNVVVSEMASGVYFLTIQINGTSEQIRVMVD